MTELLISIPVRGPLCTGCPYLMPNSGGLCSLFHEYADEAVGLHQGQFLRVAECFDAQGDLVSRVGSLHDKVLGLERELSDTNRLLDKTREANGGWR